jgi:hypothetical protein
MKKAFLSILPFGFCFLFILFSPSQSLASLIIDAGYDLLLTVPTTQFGGQSYVGVPCSTFDFGGSIGVENVGLTDTIVYRTQNATVSSVGDTATIPIEIVWLSLKSENPFLPGGQYAYITLQPGHPTTGAVSITFGPEGNPHGTFSSFFDVFFDVHYGSLNGPIIQSGDKMLSTTTAPEWAHNAPANVGVPLITGVNYLLNGTDTSEDFWSWGINGNGLVIHDDGQGTVHTVTDTPEPATLLVLGLGGLLLRKSR